MKTNNAKAIAARAADLLANDNRADLSALYIRENSRDGVTACAATLATAGALYDRNRADLIGDLKSAIPNAAIDGQTGAPTRRRSGWLAAVDWLRDGGDADPVYMANLTVDYCRTKPAYGMSAAYHLLGVLYGRGPVLVNAPAIFERLAVLVAVLTGSHVAPAPQGAPFTVFILDCDRDACDPYVSSVRATDPESLIDAAIADWAAHKLGAGVSAGRARAAWHECGGTLLGIIPGAHSVLWQVYGVTVDDIEANRFDYNGESRP